MNTLLRTVLRGAIYSGLRRLPLKLTLALGLAALVAFVYVNGARAASSCPTGDESCIAITERLDELGQGIAALPQSDLEYDYAAVLAAIESNTANVPAGSQEIAGVVALSTDDRDRLDLAWWGMWAAVGLLLVLMIAPAFGSALHVTRGM